MVNKYEKCYPQYDNCIVNVMSTICEYFGVPHKHAVNAKLLDRLRAGKYHKVVLLVLDGLGSCNIADNLSENSFLARHKMQDISSVFPPTTFAALNSIESESMPNEHCRLGWDRHFSKYNMMESGFDTTIADIEYPIKDIHTRFKKHGVASCIISPFAPKHSHRADTLQGILDKIAHYSDSEKTRFIYAYYNEPDTIMHRYGTQDEKTQMIFEQIDKKVSRLQGEISPSTAVIVMADHGQIDGEIYTDLSYEQELMDCLAAPLACEPTAISIRLKPDKQEQFKSIFPKYFDGYELVTARDAIEQKLFGIGENNEKLQDAIGDYMAISVGRHVAYRHDCSGFKGIHAGLHYGEMTVPLIFFDASETIQ